jgi:hypothetical protein
VKLAVFQSLWGMRNLPALPVMRAWQHQAEAAQIPVLFEYRISGPIERMFTRQERGISRLPVELSAEAR